MPGTLVCPECGGSEFTATLTTRTEYTYNAYAGMQPLETTGEVVDGGDLGDVDEFTCTECGLGYENLDTDNLMTADQYECEHPRQDDDTCLCPDCGFDLCR